MLLDSLLTDMAVGWRNLGRNRKRTALTWGAIALAQAALVWMTAFMNGYQADIFDTLTGPMLGHVQVHAPKYLDDNLVERVLPRADALEKAIAGLPRVASVSPRVYGPVLAAQKQMGHVAMVAGLDLALEDRPGGLLAGLPARELPGRGEALVGRELARSMGLKPGDTLALMGQAADGSIASGLYRVKGLVETAVEPLNRNGILMGLAQAQDLLAMPDEVHEIVVKADSPADIPGVAAAMRGLKALSGDDVRTWDQLAPQIASILKVMGHFNLVIMVLVFITTVAGVANTMLMATYERGHEFGMLLSLGCRPGRLSRMLLMEALVLGLAGVATGTALGLAFTWHQRLDMSAFFGGKDSFAFNGMNMSLVIPYIPRARDVLMGVGAVMATSALACLWPARRISRMEPSEALRS